MRKQIKYQRLNNINVTHLSSFLSLMFTSASATWSIRQTQYVSRFKPAWNWSFFFFKFLTCFKRDLFEKSHNTYHVKGQQCCLLSQARLCINSLYSWSLRLYCQFSPLEAISLLLICFCFFFSYCLICNGVVYFTNYLPQQIQLSWPTVITVCACLVWVHFLTEERWFHPCIRPSITEQILNQCEH